ncbi:uncharacterized protein LOC126210517 [Schistocerca nitens]|uniref:uncharacterized protein LOC126210517 n=1 Tax=Schistocerca nitens TaxID=7011 RepID=UPI0021174842|nr:uncharacterized protein LOC126210517 [Schistocerca nitens]
MATVLLDDGSVYRKHINLPPPQLQLDRGGGVVPPAPAGPQPHPPPTPPTPHPPPSPPSPGSPQVVAPEAVPTPMDVDALPRPGFFSPADPGSDVDMGWPPSPASGGGGARSAVPFSTRNHGA